MKTGYTIILEDGRIYKIIQGKYEYKYNQYAIEDEKLNIVDRINSGDLINNLPCNNHGKICIEGKYSRISRVLDNEGQRYW